MAWQATTIRIYEIKKERKRIIFVRKEEKTGNSREMIGTYLSGYMRRALSVPGM